MKKKQKHGQTMPSGMEINLCDFALFLSVMKNPEAHEIILQIIMDDPTLKLEEDDIRKRSRYYQGLLDTPILKSGKETRYKNLPSTVIIFITKEDIFGENLAKYTFTEQ